MRVPRALASTVVIMICAVSLLASRRTRPDQTPQTSRPPAPEFSVNRFSDGRKVSLSDLRGKVVLLYFFFPS